MATKPCCRCGVTKSLDEFHNLKGRPDGRNPACKECICAARRQYTADHPEKLQASRKRARAKDPEKERARSRAWYHANKERASAYYRAYVEANAASVAAAKREWYLANREHVLAWTERNPEKAAEKLRRYRENHRDVLIERAALRRARKLGTAIGPIDLEALWTGSCALCGGGLDAAVRWPDPLSKSVDHIVPLSLGGPHTQDNLQWTHLRCNVSKGARLPSDEEVA